MIECPIVVMRPGAIIVLDPQFRLRLGVAEAADVNLGFRLVGGGLFAADLAQRQRQRVVAPLRPWHQPEEVGEDRQAARTGRRKARPHPVLMEQRPRGDFALVAEAAGRVLRRQEPVRHRLDGLLGNGEPACFASHALSTPYCVIDVSPNFTNCPSP